MDRSGTQITPAGVPLASPCEREHSSQAPARALSDGGAVAGLSSSGPASADRAGPVSFTMPTPPSANHLFKNVKGVGRVKAAHYDDFVRMGIAAIRRQNVPSLAGNVIVILGVERMSANADIDNRLKAMLDTIVKAGVIADDSLITAIAIAWMPKANGLSHISILPVQKLEVRFHPSQNGTSGGWFFNVPHEEEDYGDQPI